MILEGVLVLGRDHRIRSAPFGLVQDLDYLAALLPRTADGLIVGEISPTELVLLPIDADGLARDQLQIVWR